MLRFNFNTPLYMATCPHERDAPNVTQLYVSENRCFGLGASRACQGRCGGSKKEEETGGASSATVIR